MYLPSPHLGQKAISEHFCDLAKSAEFIPKELSIVLTLII